MTVASDTPARARVQRYFSALWLLARRDLRVRYSTSFLGYFWSLLDPLLMAAIYYFVFTQVFHRDVGETPYIVFLLTALLPWTWFNGTISDTTRVYLVESKLIRSTKIPRTIWVASLVLSKGIEFVASIPVLAIFAIATGAQVHWEAFYFLLAIAMQVVLTLGIGLIVAPLVVFFRDLNRAIKLLLRFLFYASPIIYGVTDLPASLHVLAAFNPLSGILSLYRSAFFPEQFDTFTVAVAALMSLVFLGIGILVFRRTERAVLKEI